MITPQRVHNLFLGCCPPLRTLKQVHIDDIWEAFHEDLLNGGEAVGRVADVLQYLLYTVNIPDIPFERHSEFFDKGGEIDNLDISGKLRSYMDMIDYESNMAPEEADRYSRNLATNLLRGFRYIKEGKPVFQLPEQDKRDLVDFISIFAFPPLGRYSRE